MATAITKTFSVGDTVYVRYPFSATHDGVVSGFSVATRTVSNIAFIAASNECIVSFSDGNQVQDGATVRVYITSAACATAIVDQIISLSASLVGSETSPVAVVGTSGTATALRRWKA